jgi:glycosyltransferase involved in cell wall biosynthesis
MKRVALVAAHFPPSNLASVHRARLWSLHLPEFGWEPTIVTTHHRHYQEALDWDLAHLVPRELRVVRTSALPPAPFRLVGDLGARALPFHYAALARLARARAIDFVHITVPSFYSAVLGRPIWRRYHVPYGIDYIDPWVHEWPGADRPLSKAATSAALARRLEPWAVRDARLITGVAPEYYEPTLSRHPHLRAQAVAAAMPYGHSELDFEAVEQQQRQTFLFDRSDGLYHLLYAGALLPHGVGVLECVLQAARIVAERNPKLRLHFAGTGRSPEDTRGFRVRPIAERLAVAGIVSEHPARIPYLDVLNHLCRASAVLVLGSSERHYSPSKAFQAVQSGRPVLGVLHEASTAADFLRRAGAGPVVTFPDGGLPDVATLAAALKDLLDGRYAGAGTAGAGTWEAHSARASARALAEALDRAILGVSRAG